MKYFLEKLSTIFRLHEAFRKYINHYIPSTWSTTKKKHYALYFDYMKYFEKSYSLYFDYMKYFEKKKKNISIK